ncbi:MAG: hypothetical protein HKN16_02100 [Saprospiraceae bacterium]|nr:hypothetical protein [Saprospiraceae bacterium]
MTFRSWILILVLFSISCTGTKVLPSEYTKPRIAFGSSGGIANLTTEYHLLDNGALFVKKDDAFESLRKVDLQRTSQIFSNIDFLGLKSAALKDPGNMTQYLRIISDESTHEIAWGGNQKEVSKEITIFYQTLMDLVNQ